MRLPWISKSLFFLFIGCSLLEPETIPEGIFKIYSSPSGADIILNNTPTGLQTPADLKVVTGFDQHVRVMKQGHFPSQRIIRSPDDEGLEVYFNLVKTPAQELLYVHYADFQDSLKFLNLDGYASRTLFVDPHLSDPLWSPDGRYVLLTTNHDHGAVILNPRGEQVSEFSPPEYSKFCGLQWDPSGDGVLYGGERAQTLIRFDIQTQTNEFLDVPKNLAPDESLCDLSLSPDGQSLACIGYDGEWAYPGYVLTDVLSTIYGKIGNSPIMGALLTNYEMLGGKEKVDKSEIFDDLFWLTPKTFLFYLGAWDVYAYEVETHEVSLIFERPSGTSLSLIPSPTRARYAIYLESSSSRLESEVWIGDSVQPPVLIYKIEGPTFTFWWVNDDAFCLWTGVSRYGPDDLIYYDLKTHSAYPLLNLERY